MKLLLLSDLHLLGTKDHYLDNIIKELIEENSPDIVVISGDIHETSKKMLINPFKHLSRVCLGVKTIFTLGNHEFFYRDIEQVHKEHNSFYRPEKYDVHCLDLLGHYDIKHVRFLGNVLWYDGSMSTLPVQNLYDWGAWMDRTIGVNKHFDYFVECRKCCKQIEESIKSTPEGMTKIMVTHCVPHSDLNGHMFKVDSPYNAYSGVADYLEYLSEYDMQVDYSISGHTHKRVMGKEIAGVKCINIGNDSHQFEYHILEV